MSISSRLDSPDHLYRLLVQGVAEYAIYMIDPNGIVTNWNAGAERTKGYKEEEIIGSHFARFYSEKDQALGLPQHALDIARRTGSFEGEGWRIRKDGSRFWATVLIDPIYLDGAIIGFAKITRDLTRQYLSQKVNERNLDLLINGTTDYMMYLLDPSGSITSWNSGSERATGYRAAEVLGQHFSIFYRTTKIDAHTPEMALFTASSEGRSETEGWHYCKNGGRFWARMVIEPVRDEEGILVGFANITRDLTEQRKQANQVQHLSQNLDLALANISQALCLFDPEGKLVLCNPRVIEMFGISTSQTEPGAHFNDLMRSIFGRTADQNSLLTAPISNKQHCAKTLDKMFFNAPTDVKIQDRIISLSHRPLPRGGWVTTLDDMSERRKSESQVLHLAHHDALTGLPNRILIEGRLKELLCGTNASKPCALLYLDLDHFKPVNDSLGHAAGDELLCAVAGRLLRLLREYDMVARIGGDEFVIVQANHNEEGDASALAGRVLEALSRPFSLKTSQVTIGVSIGIAIAPEHGMAPNILLRNADLALYKAKGDGKNCYRFFHSDMEMHVHQRRDLEIDLRNAVKNKEFELYYQPMMNLQDWSLTGFEALIRWHSPKRGSVPPSEFIPFAEEIGLMQEIGRWVLETACREAAQWTPPTRVSVNISPTQFQSDGLSEAIQSVLECSGLPADLLELEVTETAMIHDIAGAHSTLKELARLGVRIALDDFGTGYSSLSFLRTLPFTRVKIDRSFIKDLYTKSESQAIVKAVAEMCFGLGVSVTAEGVETSEQADILRAEKPMEIQGYLISRACPATEVPGLILRLMEEGTKAK